MSRLDPPAALDAAARFGKLVAMGVLTHAECIPYIIEELERRGFVGDMSGVQMRLSHAVLDSATDWEKTRARTDSQIRRAIAPMFDAHQRPEHILAHAGAMNEAAGCCLLSHEIRQAIEDEAGWWLRRTTAKRRRHAG